MWKANEIFLPHDDYDYVLFYCPIISTGGTVGREMRILNSGDISLEKFVDSHLRLFPQMTFALIHSY
jgi:hypothetical protein